MNTRLHPCPPPAGGTWESQSKRLPGGALASCSAKLGASPGVTSRHREHGHPEHGENKFAADRSFRRGTSSLRALGARSAVEIMAHSPHS